jgi:cytochrome o ubiquinol oxidase subunit 1
VDSHDAWWDMKIAGYQKQMPENLQPIHMPKNTYAGLIIGGLATLFGFAAIWHITWIAIISLAGCFLTWILKSFDQDVDYYIQIDEIEAIERKHFDEVQAGLKAEEQENTYAV